MEVYVREVAICVAGVYERMCVEGRRVGGWEGGDDSVTTIRRQDGTKVYY